MSFSSLSWSPWGTDKQLTACVEVTQSLAVLDGSAAGENPSSYSAFQSPSDVLVFQAWHKTAGKCLHYSSFLALLSVSLFLKIIYQAGVLLPDSK